jgi:hypothetical protein
VVRSSALLLAALLIAALVVGEPAGTAASPVDELIQAQTHLVDRTREYRSSLEQVLALQEEAVERAEAQVRVRKDLLERGIVSRREAEEADRAAEAARSRRDETRAKIDEADALMGETLAAIELARMPKAPPNEVVVTSAAIRYDGTADLDADNVSSLEGFFARRFGRALPVSARGQTATHDRMGLDHRHAIDVAVHPDSEEGRALLEYLRLHRIPFLAFRRLVPGASTGAHVHVGPTSPRLVPVRTIGR